MRVLFAGSPEIAVPALRLLAASHELVGVLTNPESAQGRGLCAACTPIAAAAGEFTPPVPVLSPQRLGPAEREAVALLKPDILVVFAYGRIFGPKFLALFPLGGVNVHPSLLPRWRGCAPIPFAILNGDQETGISVQRVALKMDTGDILARLRIPLDGTETTGSLSDTVSRLSGPLLLGALSELEHGAERCEKQDESQASYCHAFTKEEGRIDWSLPADEICARIRAFDPWPVTWTMFAGQRLAVLEGVAVPARHVQDTDASRSAGSGSEGIVYPAGIPGTVLCVDKSLGIMVQTGDGPIALRRLQLQGKKPLAYKDFMNGVRDFIGTVLG